MIFKYPCKICLVQAACTEVCDKEKDYHHTKRIISAGMTKGWMVAVMAIILGWNLVGMARGIMDMVP